MLILAHNYIKQIPAKVFRHLPLLNSLELDGNQISHIHDEAFVGLEGKNVDMYFDCNRNKIFEKPRKICINVY